MRLTPPKTFDYRVPARRSNYSRERAPYHEARSWPRCPHCGWLVCPDNPAPHARCASEGPVILRARPREDGGPRAA